MIAITGANGNLGQLVVKGLLQAVPANQIIAAVRRPEKADELRTLGVQIREADYDRFDTLVEAYVKRRKIVRKESQSRLFFGFRDAA